MRHKLIIKRTLTLKKKKLNKMSASQTVLEEANEKGLFLKIFLKKAVNWLVLCSEAACSKVWGQQQMCPFYFSNKVK